MTGKDGSSYCEYWNIGLGMGADYRSEMEGDSESFPHVAAAQSAFIHTLFSAGAGLSLSEEEPRMEGGGAD